MRRHDRQGFRTVAGVLVLLALVIALLIACVTLFPTWLVGPDSGSDGLSRLDRLKADNDVRLTLLQGLGGLLALGGVALGAAATLRQIRVNREGNTIGLFTKAIDQLSSDNVSVRQGGIYAMELLSGLDPAYSGHVHALLTAFVRQRAPWPPPSDKEEQVESDRARFHGGLADDVGAALAALSRRSMVEEGAWSELERVDLRGADLAGLNFRQTCFVGSNLDGAKLTDANLTNATLSHVTLRDSDLSGANLTGANLDDADLTGVTSDNETKWPAGFEH